MLQKQGKKILQIYVSDKLEQDFTSIVEDGKKSETIRGMMMLYLQNMSFKRQVDNFVAVTKTI